MSDQEVERWLAEVRVTAAMAQEYLDRHPGDPAAEAALERATTELAAAMVLRARRLGEPRRHSES